ncbi:hypothetical protein NONI108955_10895 [Nocardia ninae]|uniref:Uncharacterized protein n=1 Tax=Nocardia ninae NBRC 108245 TaxID=1210091 RepID=A0A511MMZ7_9NOCA|nr:hypothetical protein [Nocardia ninae]GEM41995.1 hypothetical protein NN4_65140 [Nocardia ninae NBRC 108245]
MSDGYSQDRDQVPNHERGKIFERGTDRFFHDREHGYTQGSRKYEFRDDKGRTERIEFDKIKDERDRSRTDSIEEKSGRIEGRKDEKQLRGVRELLERGEINHHTLRSVEGELISKECQKLIDGLRRDFPDQFTHRIISRTEARAIWAIGQDLERTRQVELSKQGKQLELPGVGEKAREEKAQELQKRRDRIAALAKIRDRKERARARLVKIRAIVKAREEADRARAAAELAARRVALEFPAPDQLRRVEAPTADRARAPESERDRVTREAAEKAVREFPFPVPNLPREQPVVEIGERPTPEVADAADKAKTQEAHAQQIEANRKEMDARNVPDQVQKIMGLGQTPVSPAEVERRRQQDPPQVVRGGRAAGLGTERGQDRIR